MCLTQSIPSRFDAICQRVPLWAPPGTAGTEEDADRFVADQEMGQLRFDTFDTLKVLSAVPTLTGSKGLEYELDEATLRLDPKERLKRQRLFLNQQLQGEDAAAEPLPETGLDGLLDVEDLSQVGGSTAKRKRTEEDSATDGTSDVTTVGPSVDLVGMSARERNKAKRMAKKAKKAGSTAVIDDGRRVQKDAAMAVAVTDQTDPNKVVVESKISVDSVFGAADEWPFQARCEELCNDLFQSQWEFRHGAATALFEIIKTHGSGGGMAAEAPASALAELNQRWLEDMAIRFVSVCALDRFGDYRSDNVVAPVREASARALGATAKHMDPTAVARVLEMLLVLQKHSHWQVRHGGLLGVKYLILIRPDMVNDLLDQILPVITTGLADAFDDVRSAAAEALLPISEHVVARKDSTVEHLLTILWDSLTDLDDLTASTSSVLRLLAELIASSDAAEQQGMVHSAHVPRLWPFFRHTLTSVRSAVLQTLQLLLSAESAQSWLPSAIEPLTRLTFQNLLVEENSNVRRLTVDLWTQILQKAHPHHVYGVVTAHIGTWLGLLVTQPGVALAPDSMLVVKHTRPSTDAETSATAEGSGTAAKKRKKKGTVEAYDIPQVKRPPPAKSLVGGATQETAPDPDVVLEARVSAARALGMVLAACNRAGTPVEEASTAVLELLTIEAAAPKLALRRTCGGLIAAEWAASQGSLPSAVYERLVALLTDSTVSDVSFAELNGLVSRLRGQVGLLLKAYSASGIPTATIASVGSIKSFNVVNSKDLLHKHCAAWDSQIGSRDGKRMDARKLRCNELQNTINTLEVEWHDYKRMIQSTIAGAVVATGQLPPTLNSIIKPIMESLKKERSVVAQGNSALALARLLRLCKMREKCPNAKIVTNVFSALCKDPNTTPLVSADRAHSGVATLERERLREERVAATAARSAALRAASADVQSSDDGDRALSEAALAHRGASIAFCEMAKTFGPDLFTDVPALVENILKSVRQCGDLSAGTPTDVLQTVVNGMQLIETVCPHLDGALLPQVLDWTSVICGAIRHPHCAVRGKAAEALAACAAWQPGTVLILQAVIASVIPVLQDSSDDYGRKGASEVLHAIVSRLGMTIIPFLVVLVIPLLGRMSDFDSDVREIVSRTFAALMVLMPLEAGVPDPPDLSKELATKRRSDRRFLEQLLDPSKLDHYKMPPTVNATLRSYQQDGLNWMHFLNVYQLHGILCDDMGLGKTLQSICIVAADHYENSGSSEEALPSLIVCPSTLTSHWYHEFGKFCSSFRVLEYAGATHTRRSLRSSIPEYDAIVLSYDTLRRESDFFCTLRFNYCVLDEGHIIKNPRSKITIAVKQVQARHRLLLSGTPIQNNVLELWSLFDYLMPGFLGTEAQFNRQYGKPIAKSADAKATSKDQEAGTLALERLHRQVLPFLLRRMKEDVLADLPPKIIQDYNCDLSPLQVRLYGAFAKSQIESVASDAKANRGHIFKALGYLRKVCNHPKLVLSESHPWFKEVTADLRKQGTSLNDIKLSAKLSALHQLLLDCGLQSPEGRDVVVSQHRFLIFAQSKGVLDMIATDLFAAHMPWTTYLRLDGSVVAAKRQAVVNNFNEDPSIDVLLLTTAVGGLGLTLTGADTVIFVEHDWNPSKDHQAMDRAHRIGQTKVVNVYRLITRGTLEEKIMGLQKFKQSISNTVISSDNASLASMGTDQLLDLFEVDKTVVEQAGDAPKAAPSKPLSIQDAMQLEDDGWDESQYESAFSVDSFRQGFSDAGPKE